MKVVSIGGRIAEIRMRRAPSQTKFRVMAWTESIRYDELGADMRGFEVPIPSGAWSGE